MKKVFTLVFLFFSAQCVILAQTFEGVLKVTTNIQIGSEQEAKALEDNLKKPSRDLIVTLRAAIDDPTTSAEDRVMFQEKLQTLEQLVNKPLFKNSSEVLVKGTRIKSTLESGSESSLLLLDQNMGYKLYHNKKQYKTNVITSATAPVKNLKVTKTGDTTSILGYHCLKYIITSGTKKDHKETIVWATPEIQDVNWKYLVLGEIDDDPMVIAHIQGMPMKINGNSGKLFTSYEVLAFERKQLADAEFELPSGYQEAVDTTSKKKK